MNQFSTLLFIGFFSSISWSQQLVFNQVLNESSVATELTQFNIDPKMGLPAGITGGHAQIRMIEDKAVSISLSLSRPFLCKGTSVCVMVMPLPVEIQVNVHATSINDCGDVIYDGLNKNQTLQLRLVDHSQNHCSMSIPEAMTEVLLTSKGAQSLILGNGLSQNND